MGIDNNTSSSISTNDINITMEEKDTLEIECKLDCSNNNDAKNNNDKPEMFFLFFYLKCAKWKRVVRVRLDKGIINCL